MAVLLNRQDRTRFSHFLSNTWLTGIWQRPWGSFLRTPLWYHFNRRPHFYLELGEDSSSCGEQTRSKKLWANRKQQKGGDWRGGMDGVLGEWGLERRGGAVCLFQCLAQLGLVKLQAHRGSQVFSPGTANSLWWCSYMFNYALEPACLYLRLIGKHSSPLCMCVSICVLEQGLMNRSWCGFNSRRMRVKSKWSLITVATAQQTLKFKYAYVYSVIWYRIE